MSRILESHQIISATNQQIWQEFQQLDGWRNWWHFCRSAAINNSNLKPNIIFHLNVKGMPAALRHIRIMELKPERFLAGIGQRRGITVKISWSFIPQDDGTQVILRLELWGVGLLPRLLLGRIRFIKTILEDGLKGLKRIVEERSTSGLKDESP